MRLFRPLGLRHRNDSDFGVCGVCLFVCVCVQLAGPPIHGRASSASSHAEAQGSQTLGHRIASQDGTQQAGGGQAQQHQRRLHLFRTDRRSAAAYRGAAPPPRAVSGGQNAAKPAAVRAKCPRAAPTTGERSIASETLKQATALCLFLLYCLSSRNTSFRYARSCRVLHCRPDTSLFDKGDDDKGGFFVVLTGSVRVEAQHQVIRSYLMITSLSPHACVRQNAQTKKP